MKILKVKLEYWLPGITIGASGARENSLRDFTLEKLYDRWAIMLVTLIYSGPKKGLVQSILSRVKCVSLAPYATDN